MRKLNLTTMPEEERATFYQAFRYPPFKIYKDITRSVEISSVEEWFEYCPPAKGRKQWVDMRSAKEMAKFWTDTRKQNDFLLSLQKVSKDLTFSHAFPEMATKFDDFRRPRINDLCVYALEGNKQVLISIEGKADEPFGNYVYQEWAVSIKRKITKSSSKGIDRLIGLYERFDKKAIFLKLRYQLTYWLAGVIDEAERNKIDTVFLIVQEFHSKDTAEKKRKINEQDLNCFVNFISRSDFENVNKNEIVGPIKNQFTKHINLYIGKYQTYLD